MLKVRGIVVALLLWAALTVAGQGAPEQIFIAVRDLSARLGRDVLLTDMDEWRWEQQRFPDTSLGCPAAGQVYQQVPTVGYLFTLVYRGTTYDYRVSVDGLIVTLCQNTTPATPVVPFTPGAPYSNPLCPAPEAGKKPFMRNRLLPGMEARVDANTPHRLRDAAALTGGVLLEMPGFAPFRVVGGPTCADEIVWWQVDYNGTVGWTAEGLDGDYYIEPLPPPAELPARQVIYATNAGQVALLAQTQGNLLPVLSWSPTGEFIALPGGVGSDAIWLYDPARLTQPPFQVAGEERLLSLAFHPNGNQVLLGTTEGGAHLWNIRATTPIAEALYLKTHERNTIVALYPDGTRFAAAGVNAQTTVDVDRAHAIVIWSLQTVSQVVVLPGHTAPVIDLAFSPDGSWLASADSSGNVMITNVAQPATRVMVNGGGVRTLAFSGNSQFIAAGKASGSIDLLNPATGAVISTLNGHLGSVNGVAFSPDSTLLASVSSDGTLRLWSTQDDRNVGVIEVGERGGRDVVFNPAGNLLVVAGDDNRVRFYGIAAP
ncbi:MAG: WD40 repeat domain-containing protein [Anaerolineae bacterium]|nr:WD40 repeat domain-containing protein [Anaerolineae bacterium]